MKVLKIALIVRKGQKISPKIPLKGYVPLGWWNSVWTTMPGVIQRKNQKMFPGHPKINQKKKISFKTILPFAALEPNCRFDNKAANFPPQIRNLFAQRRKLFQEANNVFVKVFLWTPKMHFWQFCWKLSSKFEKFWLKMHFRRLLK